MTTRYLLLENGSVYTGQAFGLTKIENLLSGELVFNTGMTGYQESLTDPSYFGQLLVFTYPLIGNYGISKTASESFKTQASAVIVHELARRPSHNHMQLSFDQWAKQMSLPGLTGIDTRALTIELRQFGTMKAVMTDVLSDQTLANLKAGSLDDQQVQQVTTPQIYEQPGRGLTIAVVDFGLKQSILHCLKARHCRVIVLPADSDAQTILAYHPDGVLLSNGPGDPKSQHAALDMIRTIEQVEPLFGICLGHQLFALANGASTYKMSFGHRGFNHAVSSSDHRHLDFTAQNHGYAVDEASLADTDLLVTYREVNDHTVEGLKSTKYPAFSVQFHPEAAPGPHDTGYLYDDFLKMIQKAGT